MKTLSTLLLMVCLSASAQVKISQYPNTNALAGSWLFIVAAPGSTNYNITYDQLRTLLSSSGLTNFNLINTVGQTYTTNQWAGPTNSITLGATNHYYFKAVTSCAVTGFVFNPFVANPSVLTVSNASGSNITFTITSNPPQEDPSTSYTVTNGFVLKCWMEAADLMTNHVARVFRH